MKTRYRMVGVAALLVGCAAMMKDPFAGRWRVRLVPDGAGSAIDDTLTFPPERLNAEGLMARGWTCGKFDQDVRGAGAGAASFTAEFTHAKDGVMYWTGQVTAADIRGTVRWKNGEKETTYQFTGSKN